MSLCRVNEKKETMRVGVLALVVLSGVFLPYGTAKADSQGSNDLGKSLLITGAASVGAGMGSAVVAERFDERARDAHFRSERALGNAEWQKVYAQWFVEGDDVTTLVEKLKDSRRDYQVTKMSDEELDKILSKLKASAPGNKTVRVFLIGMAPFRDHKRTYWSKVAPKKADFYLADMGRQLEGPVDEVIAKIRLFNRSYPISTIKQFAIGEDLRVIRAARAASPKYFNFEKVAVVERARGNALAKEAAILGTKAKLAGRLAQGSFFAGVMAAVYQLGHSVSDGHKTTDRRKKSLPHEPVPSLMNQRGVAASAAN